MIFGAGINDVEYRVRPKSREICPYYSVWHSMMTRCYSERYHEKKPTYKNCEVCEEWLIFSNFKAWMETKNWEYKQLDKDIFGDGKLYSPETCCFVEPWLNSIFNDCGSSRQGRLLGVRFCKRSGSIYAELRIDGKKIYLGVFDNKQDAHKAYCIAKQKHILNKVRDYPDREIKSAIIRRAECLIE